jgi:3-methyladenine DNA glycosylase AlkD
MRHSANWPMRGRSSRNRVPDDQLLTAEGVLPALEAAASPEERAKIRARMPDGGAQVIGVRMGTVFDIAKANTRMPLSEVDRLFDSDVYEVRVVAVSILDFKARARGLSDDGRRELYDLWMRRLDRIDTWDLIDRSAPRVVGWYLLDKPRDVLFDLAGSPDWWRRRAAITAAFWIIRSGDLDDPLALCEILAADPEHFVQTNVGVALREIGRVDPARLKEFLARRGGELSRHARRTARSSLVE